jgi:hypothetical protein
MKKLLLSILLGLCTPLFCLGETGSTPTALENELLEALKLNNKGDDRRVHPEVVISDYAAKHLIDLSRTKRVDSDNFYVLRKPAKLLGHDLLVISWAQDTARSYGLTVYVRVIGDDANLAAFAKTNRCNYAYEQDLGSWQLFDEHPPIVFPKGRHASLACTDEMFQDWE